MFERKNEDGIELTEIVKDIEKNIHLIWLGSQLRQKHLERLLRWKKLNPDYTVTIWIDAAHESSVKKQLDDAKIDVKSVESLSLSEKMTKSVRNFTDPREDKLPPNYAAASDVYRLKISHVFGGCYADTDVEPFDVSKIKRNKFGFLFPGERNNDQVSYLAIDVIAATANNIISKTALELFEAMSDELTDEHIKFIRSNMASDRYYSTMITTGFLLRGALGKFNINNTPIVEVDNKNDGVTRHPHIFDSMSSSFPNHLEQTWILSNVDFKDNSCDRQPLEGITLDKTYWDDLNGNLDDREIYKKMPALFKLRHKAYAKISAKNADRPTVPILKNGFFYPTSRFLEPCSAGSMKKLEVKV